MKNKGCLLMRPLMLKAKSSEIFQVPTQKCQILAVFGAWWSGVRKKFRFLLQKAHLCVDPRRLSHFAWKLVRGCDLQVCWEKNKVTNIVYFTYLRRSSCWSDRHQIWFGVKDFQDVINCAKFYSNPFRGFDFIEGQILAFAVGTRCRR